MSFCLLYTSFGGETTIKDDTENLNKAVGSGPFKLKEYKEGDSIVYERYDDYYRGKASLDQVVIKLMPDESAQEAALQSGEISMMRITNQTKLDKYSADDNYTVYNLSLIHILEAAQEARHGMTAMWTYSLC